MFPPNSAMNITLNGERLDVLMFPHEDWDQVFAMSVEDRQLSTCTWHGAGGLNQGKKARKRNKKHRYERNKFKCFHLQMTSLSTQKRPRNLKKKKNPRTDTWVQQGWRPQHKHTKIHFFFLFFGHTHGIWKFLGQGSNPSHSSTNARDLTHYARLGLKPLPPKRQPDP